MTRLERSFSAVRLTVLLGGSRQNPHASAGRRHLVFFGNEEHVVDLGDDAIERAMFLAQDVACSAQPDLQPLPAEQRLGRKRQDRDGSAVVHLAEDVLQVASARVMVVQMLLRIRFRHLKLRCLIALLMAPGEARGVDISQLPATNWRVMR